MRGERKEKSEMREVILRRGCVGRAWMKANEKNTYLLKEGKESTQGK